MAYGKLCGYLLLTLGILAAIIAPTIILTSKWSQANCRERGYLHGAVAADSKTCSEIGRDILKKQGSAVDAAIAALICTSVINPQSMGLGGGVIFTIYNATTEKIEVINARETLPKAVEESLLRHCSSSYSSWGQGSRWIGVPGELRGYQEAHRRYGRLPWSDLFQPTIQLLRGGLRMPRVLSQFLNHSGLQKLVYQSSLRQLFFQGNRVLKEGDVLEWPTMIETLETVARLGADAMYKGELANNLLEDIRKEGSILRAEDLSEFQPEVVAPLDFDLGDYTLYTPPPPAGGAILSYILNVLKEYNFTKESVAQTKRKVDTYHLIAEVMKFANGQKWKLYDHRNPSNPKVFQDLLSYSLAQQTKESIDYWGNHTLDKYSSIPHGSESPGTSHVSVISADGSAVSVTSTINVPFGSRVYSPRTGIILNNEIWDFCNWSLDLKKKVVPGERPPSSMVPSILISRDKKSKLVIGGAGGELIIPSMALAIMNKLWFGYDLKNAIKEPIFHVNAEAKIEFEKNFSKEIEDGLRDRGHQVQSKELFLNVVQAIYQEGECLYAESDKRKLGEASGY
ncbi:LOW QUALITY PROTEIN: glutathione hydrolase 5 proenzyme [Tachyglossus aculeatus]|uniref:LOW QUALITY PROTEIN: glutathione hydrolase 5 proenzyme n=1 Tax=Tachyglossus aculeatus TaxID=9261 RepID=UPI0018F29797|nr:LOW QUALITY PROTEIN: glutathione hydrolase 5 proenzyme [Tachyglossus aculeatus]